MDLLVPQLSSTMETARVVRWLKRPGDRIRIGEAVVEVETDKSTMEVESPANGVLTEILVTEGQEVAVAGALACLCASEDSVPSTVTVAFPDAATALSGTATALSDTAAFAAVEPTPTARAPQAAAVSERILASPLARRLAAEAGLDLRAVQGSGPNSRIRKRDVLRMKSLAGAGAVMRTDTSSPTLARPVSPMRARIAETVSASRKLIPSYNLDRWVETSCLAAAQAQFAAGASGDRITFTDMLLQALADTLSQTPAMLDRWLEGASQPSIISSRTIDIGLVVALEQGLMIPTLGDLANKDLADIARTRRQAVERARAGRLTSMDTAPASMTLSNLGKSGVDRFEAIISPGQSSILAVGREHERALASGGRLYAARGVNLTLSVDHRLIDGQLGAQFLDLLANRLEQGSWRGARGAAL
jgi:pyruvate dehydrogenase E2 component (dihydrolipoyllysine-residue acetyltransferase)